MRNTRKGFTLVELLIVIGIMGILGAMGIIAGQEATSAARATAIADNLEKLATAGMMFYAENAANIDKNGTLDGSTAFTVADLQKGINAYLKADDVAAAAAANTYSVAVDGTGAAMTWWVGYQFGTTDGEVQAKKAMKNKTNRMKLKVTASGTGDAYDGSTDTVYMKIR